MHERTLQTSTLLLPRCIVLAALSILTLILIGCASKSSDASAGEPLPMPPASAVPSDEELFAVADATFPHLPQYGGYGVCGMTPAELEACPFTQRMKDHLLATNANLCRCNNVTLTRNIVVEAYEGGGVAHVTMWDGMVVSDLVIVEVEGVLLVDDQMCFGDPTTSIYVSVGPC